MKIKKGDKVKVIAGDDKGVVAEVVAALPRSTSFQLPSFHRESRTHSSLSYL